MRKNNELSGKQKMCTACAIKRTRRLGSSRLRARALHIASWPLCERNASDIGQRRQRLDAAKYTTNVDPI